MKYISFILLLFLIISCKPDANESTSLLFKGKIENPNRTGIVLSQGDFKKIIPLDENGAFSVELEGIEKGFYTLWDSVESTKVYIVPGGELELNLNAKEFDESISYSGINAAPSNYMAKKYMEDEENPMDYKKLYNMEEDAFMAELNTNYDRKLEFLEGFSDLSLDFKKLQKREIMYEKLFNMTNYEGAHQYYTKNKEFKVSKHFLDPISHIDLSNEEDFKNSASYKQFVVSHYSSGSIMENIAKLDQINSDVIMKEVLKNLQYYMSPGSKDLKEIFDGLSKYAVEESFKADLSSRYVKYQELVKGKASPGFEYPDTNGKMFKLEDFRNKVVYVDVWATWCGPCKMEIPFLKELEKEYHGKDISFISISVDKMKDKEKWLKMIEEKELGGIQLFSDKDWSSDFVKAYDIQGIPRFIMIDKSGNIVTADAPRPSSGDEIKALINEQLKL